jgi:hypothetical protein
MTAATADRKKLSNLIESLPDEKLPAVLDFVYGLQEGGDASLDREIAEFRSLGRPLRRSDMKILRGKCAGV